MNHQFKRILVFVLSLVLLFCATACSRSNETGSAQPDPSNIPSIKGMAISAAEDSKAKECISDFFNRLLTNAEVDSL